MSELPVKQNNFDRIPKCGAKSKRTGLPCQQPAMPNGRCRIHGGKSLSGPAAPAYRGKGYSKYLPINMLDAYEAARNDDALLELSDEIALVQTRLTELIPRVSTREAGSRWRELREQHTIMDAARRRGDAVTMAEAMSKIESLIKAGGDDYRTWDDIYKTMERLQRLIAQEQKRRLEMHALISTDQAVGFVSEILTIVKDVVDDPKALHTIYQGVQNAFVKRPGMDDAANRLKVGRNV